MGGQSLVKALDKEEMRDDTHATPLSAPTIAELTKAVDVVIKDTMEKALKYT